MASTSRLYTRFRDSSLNPNQEQNSKINVVIFAVNMNANELLDGSRFAVNKFNEGEVDSCIECITLSNRPVYLFMTKDVSNEIIGILSETPIIQAIYFLCTNDQCEHDPSYWKIRGIYNDQDIMLKQFITDTTRTEYQLYSEERTLSTIDNEGAEILWWRIFDKILLHIQNTNFAKEEFVQFASSNFHEGERFMSHLEEFKMNYNPDRVIYWYTRDCFVYLLVNETFRTSKNFNNIFKQRLILKDLLSQLKSVQSDSRYARDSSYTVYRGQLMSLYEVEQLQANIGNLIFSKQFFSTSLDLRVALLLTSPTCGRKDVCGVLYEIDVDLDSITHSTHPFAYIAGYSAFEDEQEVLFAMHSIFQVQSVELRDDGLWHIKLKYEDNVWDIDFDTRSIFSAHADQIFIRDLSKENKQFIAFQVLLDMTLRLEQNKYAKDELLEFCRSKYQDDPVSIKQIQTFEETYESKNAAKWYTKESFLYHLLNESLRIENIDSIVKLRYYINDLHNQLAELQPSFIKSFNGQTNLILYRGQVMTMAQLDEIQKNVDGIMSMNSFCSASQHRRVALFFSGNGENLDPHDVSTIYVMKIDTNIRSTPYAKIESEFPDEQEVLLSMGATFRIGNVSKLADKIYEIELTMTHIDDDLWKKLTAHLN